MANVLNRKTLEYLPSVNTPDYPEADFIINPDMKSVEAVPSKYWTLKEDQVVSMDTAEKEVKDAAIAAEIAAAAVPCPYGLRAKCEYIK